MRARLGPAAAITMVAILALLSATHGAQIEGATPRPATLVPAVAATSKAAAELKARGSFASIPLYFELNRGQTDPSVRYLSHAGRYTLYLTDDATVISMIAGSIQKRPTIATTNPRTAHDSTRLIQSAVRIRMIGADPHATMTGLDPLSGRVNYLVGAQTSFHANVPTFARVKIANVYPGVDVIHYGTRDSLEYDIVARPGADPSRIRFAIEGPAKTSTDQEGNVVIATPAGVVLMRKPAIYQDNAAGGRVPVEGSFVLSKNSTIENRVARRELAIRLAAYDHSRPLIIDPAMPILVYSSYLGGSGSSVAALNPALLSFATGNSPLTESDAGLAVALDSTNHAYVTGMAFSNDFPHPNAFQTSLQGANSPPSQNPNVFIAKFDTTLSGSASLIFASYLGANGDTVAGDAGQGNGDLGFGIAVDAGNQPFIVGETFSGTAASGGPNFPGTASCGAFGHTNNGKDASTSVGFISKLQADGSGVVWSCYIDGQNNSTESRVALAPAGCGTGTQCKAYIAGSTQSSLSEGFPFTANRFQSDLRATSGASNATFIVVHEDGQSLDYATWYGGSGNGTTADIGIGVAVDSLNHGYITGATFSTDLTTVNPAVSSFQGSDNTKMSNAFVAEFDPTQSGAASLIYATYLGGSGATGNLTALNGVKISLSAGDAGTGLAIDPVTGHIWVTGLTASTDFQGIPGSVPPFQSANEAETFCESSPQPNAPATAAFLEEIDTSQTNLAQIRYSTYFGGCGVAVVGQAGSIGFGDVATDIAVTGGKVFITGATTGGIISGSFPLSSNAAACNTAFPLDQNQTSGFKFDSFVNIPFTAFVVELDPSQIQSANQLVFSALLGGSGQIDAGDALKVDSNGNIVVTGLTFSTDFPTTSNAFQFANRAGSQTSTNAFLTVINPSGTICPTPTPTPTPTVTPTPKPTPTPIPGPPRISVSPSPHTRTLAAIAGATATGTVTITNIGTSQLTGNVGPASKPGFAVAGNAGPYALAPGAHEDVTVKFNAPVKKGNSKATFTITSNDKKHKLVTVTLIGQSL